jgi:hypothetical protein
LAIAVTATLPARFDAASKVIFGVGFGLDFWPGNPLKIAFESTY